MRINTESSHAINNKPDGLICLDKENRTAADPALTTKRLNALKPLEGGEHQEKDEPCQTGSWVNSGAK